MKTIFTALALIASVTSASAMAADGLSATDAFAVRSIVPNADLSDLTSAQASAIKGALHGDDREVGGQIRAILLWN
jgi:hypothetical protein